MVSCGFGIVSDDDAKSLESRGSILPRGSSCEDGIGIYERKSYSKRHVMRFTARFNLHRPPLVLFLSSCRFFFLGHRRRRRRSIGGRVMCARARVVQRRSPLSQRTVSSWGFLVVFGSIHWHLWWSRLLFLRSRLPSHRWASSGAWSSRRSWMKFLVRIHGTVGVVISWSVRWVNHAHWCHRSGFLGGKIVRG